MNASHTSEEYQHQHGKKFHLQASVLLHCMNYGNETQHQDVSRQDLLTVEGFQSLTLLFLAKE